LPTSEEIMEFSVLIEQLSKDKRLTIMEAIVYYCEETKFEIEVAATLVSSSLKSKIREEAESVNMMKKLSRLPI
jgi:hypothetical protein